MSKKYNNRAWTVKILEHDPTCVVIGCNNLSCSAHHIIYRSQWSSVTEAILGFDRDDYKNGVGLCAEHDYKFHNGDGIHGISGREYAFRKLSEYGERTANFLRWFEVLGELKKSLIRKGIKV